MTATDIMMAEAHTTANNKNVPHTIKLLSMSKASAPLADTTMLQRRKRCGGTAYLWLSAKEVQNQNVNMTGLVQSRADKKLWIITPASPLWSNPHLQFVLSRRRQKRNAVAIEKL